MYSVLGMGVPGMRDLYILFIVFLCLGQSVLPSPVTVRSTTAIDKRRKQITKRVSKSHVLHEWHEPRHTEGWVVVERARPAATLPMRIGLTQSNLDRGHELLMDIAHPDSPNYGKHLTLSQVTDMFAPLPERADVVKAWLVAEGVDVEKISRSRNQQWIQFDISAQEAEKLLHTEFYVLENSMAGIRNIACSGYHVPANIQEHVDYVLPGVRLITDGFPTLREGGSIHGRDILKQATFESDIAYAEQDVDEWLITDYELTGDCDTEVTVDCIRKQYRIPNGTSSSRGNELGVFQSLGNHYYQDDLDSYFDNLAPWVPLGTAPTLQAVDGATGEAGEVDEAGIEANLDFSLLIPLIWPQSTKLFQTDDLWYEQDLDNPNGMYKGLFNTFFDAIDGSYCTFSDYGETGNCVAEDCLDPVYPDTHTGGYEGPLMCGNYTPTNVISISYSGVEHTLPESYMKRQCAEVMKLALQGITVVESSGDHGVGGMTYNATSGCLGASQNVFSPRTMSNCPYVLSVGATVLVNASTVVDNLNSEYPGLIPTFTIPGQGVVPNPTTTPAQNLASLFPSITFNPTKPALQVLESEFPGLFPSSILDELETQTTNAFHIGVRQTAEAVTAEPSEPCSQSVSADGLTISSLILVATSPTTTSTSPWPSSSYSSSLVGLATSTPTTSSTVSSASSAATGSASPAAISADGGQGPDIPTGFVEIATTYFPSGGGFSNVFDRLSYQNGHVEGYLSSANLWKLGYNGSGINYANVGAVPGQYFNLQGRAYPDVSALGDNMRIFNEGMPTKVGGTSAAAPIWAAILTLINEERIKAGKATVGFVHPVLYAHPEAFTDITIGSNPGCGGNGFRSMSGWDPVTGLGSPVFPKLLEVFMSLP